MRRSALRRQRGEGTFGCIVWLAILGVGVWHAWVFGAPWLRYYQFKGRMDDVIQYIQNHAPEEVEKIVIENAAEFKIPLKPEQVSFEKAPGRVTIDVKYQVTCQTPLYTRTFDFAVHANRLYSQ